MQEFKGSRKNLLIRSIDELIGTGLGISQMPQEWPMPFKDKDKDKDKDKKMP